PLSPVGGGARQRAHGVDHAAAAADDPAGVLGRARHLDHDGAVLALGPDDEALGVLHEVHEAVVDEVDDHGPSGPQELAAASCRFTWAARRLALTFGVSTPAFSRRRRAVSVGWAPRASQ